MKRFIAFLMGMTLTIAVIAQAAEEPENSSAGKYFFGANYSFFDIDLKLTSMSKHSVWMGEDFGTKTLNDGEVDTLNTFVNYHDRFNGIGLSAGMAFIDKPGSDWYVDGLITLGLSQKHYQVINTNTDTTDLDIKSNTISPWFGLGFLLQYKFNPHWGINLEPGLLYAFGKTDKIDDNLYPETGYLDETRENKFQTVYFVANLLASYEDRNITISAGPGFNLLYESHDFSISRVNPGNGNTFNDNIKSELISESFFNGVIRLKWNMSDHFRFNAGAAFSRDLSVSAGLYYLL